MVNDATMLFLNAVPTPTHPPKMHYNRGAVITTPGFHNLMNSDSVLKKT